jgi:hypothetical protein
MTAQHPVTGRFVTDGSVAHVPPGATVDGATGTVSLQGGAGYIDSRHRSDYQGPGPNQPCRVADGTAVPPETAP